MIIQIALIVSVIFQFAAFIITISLIPKTRFSIAWVSISIGLLLMAIRRLDEVFNIFNIPADNIHTNISSWIAVVISGTMLIASIYIRKIFEVLNRIQELRTTNEAKLLTAIISAEERERKRFAKELHDGLGPVLSSAKMTLSAINKSNIDKNNYELINKAEKALNNAIVSTKDISNHLTPTVLEWHGLKKAINTYLRNTITKDTIKISFSTNLNKKRYNQNLEVSIYRICCELINNTLKYANADKINIQLSDNSNFIVFKYSDNGKGFNINEQEHKGTGLTNIKSRVKSLNGTINIHSKPYNGFHADIKFPV